MAAKNPQTSTQIGSLMAVSAITSAYTAYNAGQMRKIAFDHEAAMDAINAKQIEVAGIFTIADKTAELANTLALQNVIAAASGRGGGGTIQALEQTSVANLEKDVARIKATGRAKQVSTLLASESKRVAGRAAATTGVLSGISELTSGLTKAASFIGN